MPHTNSCPSAALIGRDDDDDKSNRDLLADDGRIGSLLRKDTTSSQFTNHQQQSWLYLQSFPILGSSQKFQASTSKKREHGKRVRIAVRYIGTG